MKSLRRPWLGFAGACALLAASCGPAMPLATEQAPSPVPLEETPADGVSASVKVVPASTADLGFLISAPVREVLVSEGQVIAAGQPMIVLDAPQLEYALKAAEAAYTSAERDEYIQSQGRRKLRGDKIVWDAGPPEQRKLAHARTLQAEAGVAAARAELARSVLIAPFEGTVVSITAARGEVVQPGQVVAVMGDLQHLRIETTDLSERDISRVRVGQRAGILLEALPTELGGSVAAIDPIAGRSADGDVIYKVTIELDAQPPQILWGMTGEVTISTDS